MMRKTIWIGCAVIACLMAGCSKGSNTSNVHTTAPPYKAPVVASTFIKGADISWVTQMEASNYKFYDKNGQQQDPFVLMKSLGMSAIRLRAWVNPTDGWCNTADVVKKALRAKNAGLKVMIDFHYSDVWADPGPFEALVLHGHVVERDDGFRLLTVPSPLDESMLASRATLSA